MPGLRDAIERRRVDLAAVGRWCGRPDVVHQDDEDVRRALGEALRLDALLVGGILHRQPRDGAGRRGRERQHFTCRPRASERAAAVHALLLRRLTRVERRVRALRVTRDAACGGELRVVVGPIPVAGPLPDVAGHVVEAVAVGRELRHRPDAAVAILARVFVREVHPGECWPSRGPWRELVAPRVELAAQPASRRELPLRFRRQPLARPRRIRHRVVVRDLHHGVLLATRQTALGAFGMAPVRALHVRPPLQ